MGREIEQNYLDIYYITGNTLFLIQIVTINSLQKKHSSLRILSDKAEKKDLESSLKKSAKSNEQWEQNDTRADCQNDRYRYGKSKENCVWRKNCYCVDYLIVNMLKFISICR